MTMIHLHVPPSPLDRQTGQGEDKSLRHVVHQVLNRSQNPKDAGKDKTNYSHYMIEESA